MAEAIVKGILDANIFAPRDITIGELYDQRRSDLENRYGVETTANNMDAIKNTGLVVLSIKPQSLPQIMDELGPELNDQHTVLSIIAGTKIDTLVKGLKHSAVIRVMPNTPAQIGYGMSVWKTSPSVNETVSDISREILNTLGEEVQVQDEKLIDMATALSGSGPAYVFLFIEALVEAGVYLGMQREMARHLVLQTVAGSTELVRKSDQHPAILKDTITSPGGTTAEALLTFEQEGFKGIVIKAVKEAYEKSKTLGEKK